MSILKAINAGLAFALELVMLASFGYWGFHIGQGVLAKWALALALPFVAIVIWALFFAPNADWRLPILPGVILSLGLFLLAALALYQARQPTVGLGLALIAVLNRALLLIWQQW